MKKTVFAVLASLSASALFGDVASNWLRLESLGPDRFLDGTAVPSGTVYSVVHDGAVVFSNVTDEVGWYPESVVEIWDEAADGPYTNGVLAFALFDDASGAGAIARTLAEAPARAGAVVKLAAADSPYEIVDTNKLTGPVFVGAGMTLNVRNLRGGYAIDPASTGTIAVPLTEDEVERYYDGWGIEIPLSGGGAFGGKMNLIDTNGETVLPSTADVSYGEGKYYLKAVRAEAEAGYIDIPFLMTANNALRCEAAGFFGGEAYGAVTNVTMQSGVNFERNDNKSGSGNMGGAGTCLWYSDSAGCTFVSQDHYPAVNCQLIGKGSGALKYWQFDFPLDLGGRTFRLGSASASFFLCTGGGAWQQSGQTRVVASTLAAYDADGNLIGSLAEGRTEAFGYQALGTNTMAAASALALTGKVTLRLKAYLPTDQNKDASYSGVTGIRLMEMAGQEYTAMLTEDASFGDLVWAPRREKETSEDVLTIKAKADGLTLTMGTVTAATLRFTGEGMTTTVESLKPCVTDVARVAIDAGCAIRIDSWSDEECSGKLCGAGTLVIDTGNRAYECEASSFPSFEGDVVVERGTWNAQDGFPKMTPFTVDGTNAVMVIPSGDKTGYEDVVYPAIRVINGGTLNFSGRDTYSRALVLADGGRVVLPEPASGRSLDFFRNSSLLVGGTVPCAIGGETAGAENSGVISIRRDNFTIAVEAGATLDVYSQWGYESESGSTGRACQKDGAGLVAFYRAPAQTGAFAVNAGTLKLVDAGAPTTGTITLAEGAVLVCETTAGVTQALAAVVANGSVTVRGAGTTKLASDLPNCTVEAGATLDLNGHTVANLAGTGTVCDSTGTVTLSFAGTFSPTLKLNCKIALADGVVVQVADEATLATLVGEAGSVTALGRFAVVVDGSAMDKNWKAEGRGIAAQPFDAISVNIKGGNNSRAGRAISADSVAGVVPMAGAQWSQVIARSTAGAVNGTLDAGDAVVEIRADGRAVTNEVAVAPYAACCYTAQGASTPVSGNGELMFGYLDDGEKNVAGRGASIGISNIPYSEYTLYVYFGTDQGDSSGKKIGPVYVNGTAYPSEAGWGSMAALHENGAAIKLAEGQNFIRVAGLTGETLTIVGSKSSSPADTRCGIAGFQIINTGVRRQAATLYWVR